MITEKNMTCIVCPIGCRMVVTLDDGKVTDVQRNTCKRGYAYAMDECTAPKRVLTTTVAAIVNGRKTMVPVKTNKPIPKELLFDAMAVIQNVTISQPAKIGTVVIENILDTGSDIVLTDDV